MRTNQPNKGGKPHAQSYFLAEKSYNECKELKNDENIGFFLFLLRLVRSCAATLTQPNSNVGAPAMSVLSPGFGRVLSPVRSNEHPRLWLIHPPKRRNESPPRSAF